MSCNACRLFFRRSILTKAQFECKNYMRCTIEQLKVCKCCRLVKCFDRGMSPERVVELEQVNKARREHKKNEREKAYRSPTNSVSLQTIDGFEVEMRSMVDAFTRFYMNAQDNGKSACVPFQAGRFTLRL